MNVWKELFEKCGDVLVEESCEFCEFLNDIGSDYTIGTNGCIYINSAGLRVSFPKEDNGKAYVRDYGVCESWDVGELKQYVVERDNPTDDSH